MGLMEKQDTEMDTDTDTDTDMDMDMGLGNCGPLHLHCTASLLNALWVNLSMLSFPIHSSLDVRGAEVKLIATVIGSSCSTKNMCFFRIHIYQVGLLMGCMFYSLCGASRTYHP